MNPDKRGSGFFFYLRRLWEKAWSIPYGDSYFLLLEWALENPRGQVYVRY